MTLRHWVRSGFTTLDILISRTVMVPGVVTPDTAFNFDAKRSTVGGLGGPGQWHQNGANLFLWDIDVEGDMLPMAGSITLTEASRVTLTAEGGYTITATLLTFDQARAGFTFQPLPNILRLELDAAPTLPDGESFIITLPTGGQAGDVEATRNYPARRFDPPVRDEVRAGEGHYFGISDSRYLVRQDPANP